MSVEIDNIDGASASRHIIQGWAITRMATVTVEEATPSGGWTTGTLFQAALTELIAVTGDRGTRYSIQDGANSIPTFLEQFIPESVSDLTIRIRIIYKGYPATQYEFGACLTQVESNLDRFNDLITVQYYYPSSYMYDPRIAGHTIVQGGFVQRPVPEPTFTVRFIITNGTLSGHGTLAIEMVTYLVSLVGSVNNATYTVGTLSGAARTWMVTEARGISRDSGFTYEMSFTMQYRKATWDPLVVFIDPNTGKPPPDLITGVGSKRPEVPDEVTIPTFSFSVN